jgi:hypothetical protein
MTLCTSRENRVRRLRRQVSSAISPMSKLTVLGDECLVQRRRPERPRVHYCGSIVEVETYFSTRERTRDFRPAPHWPCAPDDI